jgi:hypothetical protein
MFPAVTGSIFPMLPAAFFLTLQAQKPLVLSSLASTKKLYLSLVSSHLNDFHELIK